MSSAITPELRWHAVGRRKLGVARVYLTPGSGKWNINGRTLGDYFPRASLVSHVGQGRRNLLQGQSGLTGWPQNLGDRIRKGALRFALVLRG